jgi:hypothetical protein
VKLRVLVPSWQNIATKTLRHKETLRKIRTYHIINMLSRKRILLFSLFICSAFFSLAQYKNIVIDDGKGFNSPEEPSIAINPKNTQQLVAGTNIRNAYYSNDGGQTWAKDTLISKQHGVYGDPCIVADTSGNFYYFHLADPDHKGWGGPNFLDRMVCQRSTDGGKTWSDGSAIGINHPHQQDKEWVTIDPKTNALYISWTEFDKYESKDPKDSTRILFASSVDNGQTWSTPTRLSGFAGNCADSDSTVEGAVPAVGANGELYVAWAFDQKIYFDKSVDKGKTWLDKDIVVSDQPGGWDFSVSGVYRCNGMPITGCDNSKGPNRGTIYVNFSDQRNGKNNTDIWLVKSTDSGTTWSQPTRVNTDTTKRQQFMSWMTIDQSSGYLYVVLYDRRNYKDDSTDVFLAVSKDGGNTFTNEKINELAFKPSKYVFLGDYLNIAAVNGVVRPIWVTTEGFKTTVWTALIGGVKKQEVSVIPEKKKRRWFR